LFVRGGERLTLTPQGALLLPAVTHAFGEIAAATAAMTRPTTSGQLRFACVPALLSFWMIPRLHEFTDQFPDVQLTLIASNDVANLFSSEVDLCLLYGNGDWPDYWSRLWSPLVLFPVVSPALLNMQPLRTVRDLSNHVILHADDGREWNTWLAAADGSDTPRRRQHFMSDARLSTEAALHNQGVALGDTITAGGLIAKGELVAPFDLTVPANNAFYVACRNDLRAAPIVKVFIDWLFSALESDPMPDPQLAARKIIRSRTVSSSPS
jgi:LysR family glycine cleavage system transcriptional activator